MTRLAARKTAALWAISVLVITIISTSASVLAGYEASSAQGMRRSSPPEETRTPTFDVRLLTTQEEAHFISLTSRAMGGSLQEGSLASFWERALPAITTRDYRDITDVYPYRAGTAPPSACRPSPEQAAGNASYCWLDETIAYDESFVQSLYLTYGDVTPLAVLAHEWGHHVQTLAGLPTVDKAAELQADCYAGMYLRNLDDLGLLEAGDTFESLRFFFDIGDDRLDPTWNPVWFDAGVHGNSYERSQAQGVGYATGDPIYCLAYEDWADRPPTPFGASVTVRRPPGTSVRVAQDGSYEFEAPAALIHAWSTTVPAGVTPVDALRAELDPRIASSGTLRLGPAEHGLLTSNGWASGDGVRVSLERASTNGKVESGSAEIQVRPDGSAEVFASLAPAADPGVAQSTSTEALDALLWGYCDPQAPFPVNCATAPTSIEGPQAAVPPVASVPPVVANDPPDNPPRVSNETARQWRQRLLDDAARFGCKPWSRRLEEKWNGPSNAYTFGAAAAIQCDSPTTGVKQLAIFRFPDRATLEAYWEHKLANIRKPVRARAGACFDGRQGLTDWGLDGPSRGRVACYVDGVAKLRWFDLENNTYGILDARDKSVRDLVDWWTRHSP